ncbi:glycerophosphodiester phosphodiesterase [Alkalicoccobacillus porphyridii]|nr:glycerophosphodiester phosphodiesterase [Alkalicoccobacillus porphyridii]
MRDRKDTNTFNHLSTNIKSYNPSSILMINNPDQLKTIKHRSVNVLFPISILQGMTSAERHFILSKITVVAIIVESDEQVDLLDQYMSSYLDIQVLVLSSNLTTLQGYRRLLCVKERIWICNNTEAKAEDLIATMNRTGIRSIMLKPRDAVDNLIHFHKHAFTVWSEGRDTTDLHHLVRAGVNAILVENGDYSSKLISAYERLHILAKPIVIAHRGAPQLAAENTLDSFERALKLGADVLETDIRRTKDDRLILFHDTTINRTTSSKGPVSAYTFQQLKKIHPIIDVEYFLKYFKNAHPLLLLEVKERDTVEDLLKMITSLKMEGRVHIQSFDPQVLLKVRKQNPAIGVSLLYTPYKWSKNYLSTRFVKDTLAQTHAALNYKVSRRMNQFDRIFSFEGGPSFVWTLQSKKDVIRFWDSGSYGLIMDCIQDITTIPLQLMIDKKPEYQQENTWIMPEKAVVGFSDGSTKRVKVQWFAQGKEDFTLLTHKQPIFEPTYVFCLYRFEFNGQTRSLISKLISLKRH